MKCLVSRQILHTESGQSKRSHYCGVEVTPLITPPSSRSHVTKSSYDSLS